MTQEPDMNDSVAPLARESRQERAGRYARRTYLYGWATVVVVSLILLVALIAENTRRVKVGWVVGYSHVSLIFLVLFATVLGWVLGVATSIVFHRRTRAPRGRG